VAAQRKEIIMINPYDDLHYLSKLYREEALLEAHKRHLISLAKADRKQRTSVGRFGLKWSSLMSLLRAPEIPR
jgi:hypothetical protein